MRLRKSLLLTVFLAMGLLVGTIPAAAHDPGDLDGDISDALKGRNYTGVVAEVSPGGVPMTAMSDIRCEDGMAGIFPCHKVDLASFVPLPDLEATFVNDIWGWEDQQTGMQLAIIGSMEGTAFVDVTDGYNPVYLGTLESELPGNSRNLWGDIRVYQNHAYIGAEAAAFVGSDLIGFGLQIVDLTQFRGKTAPFDIQKANVITDFTQSHNLSLNTDSGRLYVAGAWAGLEVCQLYPAPFNGDGGSIVYDLSDPVNPVHIGCLDQEASPDGPFGFDGYNHDLQCVIYHGPDARYAGAEICISSNESEIVIYDATDPSNPVELSSATYLDLPFFDPERGVPNYYTHQGWLSEDHHYFFLGDELDEFFGPQEERTTYLWDMSDLTDPQLIGAHSDGNTSIDHNMFVDGNLLYQANYSSGLWIYDIWKVGQGRLTSRGYFDVFPDSDVQDFFGAWGTYPYFGDGKVVVSSSDEGLFVLQSRAKSAADNKGKGQGANN